jgi:two-component system cell cycle response regulator CtrA
MQDFERQQLLDRIAALEALNDDLESKLVVIQENLGQRMQLPMVLSLTASEASIIGCLYARQSCTKALLHGLLYGNRLDADVAMEKIIDVFICKLRKKLKPYGIEVETIWGHGYAMHEPSKEILNRMIKAEGNNA